MGNAIDTHAKGGGAVITGGANGIGKAVARRCLQLGMHTFIIDLNAEALAATKAELEKEIPGAQIGTCTADVSSQEDNRKMCEAALAFMGARELSFVHFNAGTSLGPSGHESSYKSDWDSFRKTIEIDLYSVFHGFQNFVPVMQKNRTKPGVVVTTASVAGLSNNSGTASYTVAARGDPAHRVPPCVAAEGLPTAG